MLHQIRKMLIRLMKSRVFLSQDCKRKAHDGTKSLFSHHVCVTFIFLFYFWLMTEIRKLTFNISDSDSIDIFFPLKLKITQNINKYKINDLYEG